MKVGIFGGTFNPIHKGHIEMIKKVKENLNLNIIYFVPSHITTDKQFKIEQISSGHRLEMVKRAVKAEGKHWLKVSDFEHKQKGISYTYKTIDYFRAKYPKDQLYWIMGEDRYKGFDKWEYVDKMRDQANIVIYRRSPEINKEIANDKTVIYVKDQFFDFSSTAILNDIRWDFIPEAVKPYITKNRLYLKTLVFNVLREKRYEHSVAVASHAKRLSVEYGYKYVTDAWYAGLIHDLFKLHSDEDLIKLVKKLDVKKEFKVDTIPTPALHGFAAALWMREEYKWDNKELFDAIASHTLTKGNTTKIDKILYVADKVSTDRKGDKVGKLRVLAYKSLDETYKKILKESIKKLERKELEPHPNTIEAYRENIDPRFKRNKYEFNLKPNKRKTK